MLMNDEEVIQPGDGLIPSQITAAPSSRLGLLRCPNAASLGWGSNRTVGDVSITRNDDSTQAAECDSLLLDDSGIRTTGDVSTSVNRMAEAPSKPENIDSKSSATLTNNDESFDKSSKPDEELVNSLMGESSRKRSRISSVSGAPSPSPNFDVNARVFDRSANSACLDGAADGSTESTSTTVLTSPNLSVVLDYERRIDNNSGGGSQILTITYHAHDAVLEVSPTSSTTVVGTISGRAKIELLPPLSETPDDEQKMDSSSVELDQQNVILSLDVFGYRMSQQSQLSCNHHIIINRPNWMNSLPISVVHHQCSNINQTKKPTSQSVLRVRIKSITDDECQNIERASSDGKNDYYGAYPEQSFEIRILPQKLIYTGNYTAAGSGVCTVLETWKHTLDKIINGIMSDDSNSITNGDSAVTVQDDTDNTHLKSDNRILLCGAKGVGKSNLLRYSTNRLLTTLQTASRPTKLFSRVAILDIDCGQAELSPPGILSLTIVSKPLLSEPPVHMICGGSCDHYGRKISDEQHINLDEEHHARHEAAYFFGDVTSKADPDTYIQMVSQLMQRYQLVVKESGDNLPLLINTDGWVKGLGYEILCAVIGVINPGHVVQIMGNTKAKSFDMSSHHHYGSITSDADQLHHKSRVVHILQSFDESIFSTLSDDDRYRRRSLESRSSSGTMLATALDHRTHRLCAYFLGGYNQMINLQSVIAGEDEKISFHKEKGLHDPNNIIGLTLSSMLPYMVPFHSVRIYPPSGLLDGITELRHLWGVQGDKTCNDVLDSLNGSIVGLCCTPDEIDMPLSSCNVGTGVPMLNCVGLGIVRSIDYRRKLFFVLTPVHPRLLTGVTSLVGGQINLPLECVYRGVHSDSFPYMSCCHHITSSNVGMESRKK